MLTTVRENGGNRQQNRAITKGLLLLPLKSFKEAVGGRALFYCLGVLCAEFTAAAQFYIPTSSGIRLPLFSHLLSVCSNFFS